MILHIIGGGAGQLSAVQKCRSIGIKTLVTDQDSAAPGCLVADFALAASTFDAKRTAAVLRAFRHETGSLPDGILVTATDQPVLTAAKIAAELDIPYFVDLQQAEWLTDKKAMKTRLGEKGIKTAPFVCLKRNFQDRQLSRLRFPVVVKPLDSQGQRGVYRLESAAEIRERFDEVISYSRKDEILVEEYYESDEITVSGWIECGRLFILSVTDRITVDNLPSIGVCVSHRYPSEYADRMPEIRRMTEEIANAFRLENGPVYFQYLIGKEGIVVNETAGRLGGAYEDRFIPYITGVDILGIMIKMSCGNDYDKTVFNGIEDRSRGKVVSLQMFFSKSGKIAEQRGMDEILEMNGILDGAFLLGKGTEIVNRTNSTQRAGWFIAAGGAKEEVDDIVRNAYRRLSITADDGSEMIQTYSEMYFGG